METEGFSHLARNHASGILVDVVAMSDQTEAWLRKKPKRIIQNQGLILLVGYLAIVSEWTLPPLLFIAVFTFGLVPYAVALSAVGSVMYVVWRRYIERGESG